MTQTEKAGRFQTLHQRAGAFLIPNPWDAGSARILAGLGFEAFATSSGAAAATYGRCDGKLTRDEALASARLIAQATDANQWRQARMRLHPPATIGMRPKIPLPIGMGRKVRWRAALTLGSHSC